MHQLLLRTRACKQYRGRAPRGKAQAQAGCNLEQGNGGWPVMLLGVALARRCRVLGCRKVYTGQGPCKESQQAALLIAKDNPKQAVV